MEVFSLDNFSQLNSQRGLKFCCRFDYLIWEYIYSLGRICVGAGLVMQFGAFSEPDMRILDDDEDDEENREIFTGGLPQDVSDDLLEH